jgi:hypothetical protein
MENKILQTMGTQQTKLSGTGPLDQAPVKPTQASEFKQEMPSIEQTQPAPLHKRSVLQWVKAQIRTRVEKLIRLWRKPATGALASAMIVGQMGLLAALVRYTYNIEPQSSVMAPAAGSKVDQDSIVLAVVFKDKATAKQIQQLLSSVQAQVTGGPGAIGIWEVAVPKDKLNDAMKILGSSKIVESAAPQ